jgi:hypothetical protein
MEDAQQAAAAVPASYSTYTVLQDPTTLKTPTCTITSKKDEKLKMRAVEYHGKKTMKVRERPRPLVTDPVNAKHTLLQALSSCMCIFYASPEHRMHEL